MNYFHINVCILVVQAESLCLVLLFHESFRRTQVLYELGAVVFIFVPL